MIDPTIPSLWSQRFGLACSPMFESDDAAIQGEHHVLLDGGHGSFGLSVMEEKADPADTAGWAWSSDLPHHVVINPSGVEVVRWDAVGAAQLYS